MAAVAFTAAALDDIAEASDWYEHQAPGLGRRLVDEIDAAVARIATNPRQYALAYGRLRRALVRGFPYGLFYLLADEQVEVVACFHTSRHPRGWRARG